MTAIRFVNQNQEFIDRTCEATRVIGAGGSLVPETYDEIDLTYNGDATIATVIYKLASVQIALLTLTYSGGNLTSVVRT